MKPEFEDFLYDVPNGWVKCTKELLEALSDYAEGEYSDLQVLQVKEKFGEGRCYLNYYTEELNKLIEDWEDETSKTCAFCGKKADTTTKGWVVPLCSKCNKTYSELNVHH